MQFSNPDFSAATRTLTGLGATTLLFNTTNQTSIAAAATVDLRTSPNRAGDDTTAVVTGGAATGATVIQAFDGTHVQTIVSTAAAANSPAAWTGAQNATNGFRIINNDASVAALYMTSGWRLSQ